MGNLMHKIVTLKLKQGYSHTAILNLENLLRLTDTYVYEKYNIWYHAEVRRYHINVDYFHKLCFDKITELTKEHDL